MKIVFELDGDKEEDKILYTLLNEKDNLIKGIFEINGLYNKIYRRDFDDSVIKVFDIESEDINGKKYTKQTSFMKLNDIEYELEQIYSNFKKILEKLI